MSQVLLVAETGRTKGSASSRRLRAEDKIPAVVYGHGMDPLSIAVNRRDLRLALSGAGGMNTLLSLEVEGTKYPAIIKEIQRHPIRRNVSHIDFLQVNVNEEITISVPLRLEGEAKAVLSDGGMIDPAVDSIEIICTPNTMPTEIVVDVTAMQPGDVIRLADITLPAGTSSPSDPDMAVVTALQTAAGLAEDDTTEDGESADAEGGDDAPAAEEASE
ncbi:MAG: 50S ribosomal protein L25 [Ilumatobacteraceae bacterium]